MKILFILFFILFFKLSFSQLWVPLDTLKISANVGTFYNDTLTNNLYISGSFRKAGNMYVNYITIWNGSTFISLDQGLSDYAYSITKYKGEIYASGTFGIKKFNDTNWIQVDTWLTDLVIFDLMVYNNELYAAGSYNNDNSTCIAKWDGNNWNIFTTPLPDLEPIIWSMCIYNNNLYVAGTFHDATGSGLNCIARWDGSVWQPLANGIDGTNGPIQKIIVYKEELYIAGLFRKEDGNIGNYIQKWNGSNWSNVGDGLFGIDFVQNGQVHDMKVINNELYVVGVFEYADSIPAKYIAKWDGNKWCGFGSNLDYRILCIEKYKNDIIIGGTFTKINNDSIQFIAKWNSSVYDINYSDTCGAVHSASIKNIELKKENVSVFPNPANSFINIEAEIKEKEDITISIYNSLGVKVYESIEKNKTGTFSKQLNISSLSSGLYIVNISINNKLYSRKLIKL